MKYLSIQKVVVLAMLYTCIIGLVGCGKTVSKSSETESTTEEAFVEPIDTGEGDAIMNDDGTEVPVVICDSTSSDTITESEHSSLPNFVILEQADDDFLNNGTGLLYVIQNLDSNDYYFIVGCDDNKYYAVNEETYAKVLNINEGLLDSCINDKTVFDTFGYSYPSAYRVESEEIPDDIMTSDEILNSGIAIDGVETGSDSVSSQTDDNSEVN